MSREQPFDIGPRELWRYRFEGEDALVNIGGDSAALGKIRLALGSDLWLAAPGHSQFLPVGFPCLGVIGDGAYHSRSLPIRPLSHQPPSSAPQARRPTSYGQYV